MTNSTARWDAELQRTQREMWGVREQTRIPSRLPGIPEWDWRLWRVGREWLAENARAVDAAAFPPDAPVRDVFVATRLYPHGGHTAVIGDFVRALDIASSARLILTNVGSTGSDPISEAICSRVGLPASSISVLQAASLGDRMQELFAALLDLRPLRLFLFHHGDDPLPPAAAQPEIARTRLLIHHSDYLPSFGMYLPGVRIVDLTPTAAALTRAVGVASAWLPLTVPDPGPRPHDFLADGRLVTASSGPALKFSTPYAFSYAETAAVILRTTGGRHVHIGETDDRLRADIAAALRRASVPPERFVHVPYTPSVMARLWDERCDLFVGSFPVDGLRTKLEVMAAAIPYLRHATRPDATYAFGQDDEGLAWADFDELTTTLQRVSDAAVLREQSARMRAVYDRMHHPCVFARELTSIAAGGPGRDDPDWRVRADRAIVGIVTSLQRDVTMMRIDSADAAAPQHSLLARMRGWLSRRS